MERQGATLTFKTAFQTTEGVTLPAGKYRIGSHTQTYMALARISSLAANTESSHEVLLRGNQLRLSFITAALPRDIIKKTIQGFFKKYGRSADFDTTVDYDRIFRSLAMKYLARYKNLMSAEDIDDAIITCLLQSVNQKTIAEYDPGRGIVPYFGGIFSRKLMNAARDMMSRAKHRHERPNSPTDDRSMDEYLETVDSRPQDAGPVNELEFKQLIKSLTAYLSKQPEGKYYLPMFDMLMRGHTNAEVAKELNVSPAIISRYFGRMKEAIAKFANISQNEDLANMVAEYFGVRKHASIETPAELQIFNTIAGLRRVHAKRAATITQIARTTVPDLGNEDTLATMLADTRTASDVKALLDQHISAMMTADDCIVRDNGDLRLLNRK